MDKENVSVNQVPMVGRKKLLITKNSASFGKDCQRGPNPKSSPLSTQVVHAPLSAQDNPQQTETSLKKGDTQSEHQNEGEKVVETQQEPKRNLTAFMHYLNINRQAIKGESTK